MHLNTLQIFWNFSSSYDDLMIPLVFVHRWNQLKNDGDFVVMTEDSQQNGKFGSYFYFFQLVRDESLLVCAQESLSSYCK